MVAVIGTLPAIRWTPSPFNSTTWASRRNPGRSLRCTSRA